MPTYKLITDDLKWLGISRGRLFNPSRLSDYSEWLSIVLDAALKNKPEWFEELTIKE